MNDKRNCTLPGRSTKILLVDDHPIVRQGLGELIEEEPDLSVCGEARDSAEALQVIDARRPDLVIVDISLHDTSGIELIKDLKARHPGLPALVLTMHDETLYAERALRAGARGYVMKEEATENVLAAIRMVLSGQIYLSQKMAARLLSKFVDGPSDYPGSTVESLSDRELQVFELIGQGLGSRQIAQQLHLSIKTIESHREHIKSKLQLTNSTELVRHAVQWVEVERSG